MTLSHEALDADQLAEQDLRIRIGMRLRRIRKERGITMVALGQIAQCSQSFLSKVESGSLMPSLPMLHRIAHALGVGPGLFLDEKISELEKAHTSAIYGERT